MRHRLSPGPPQIRGALTPRVCPSCCRGDGSPLPRGAGAEGGREVTAERWQLCRKDPQWVKAFRSPRGAGASWGGSQTPPGLSGAAAAQGPAAAAGCGAGPGEQGGSCCCRGRRDGGAAAGGCHPVGGRAGGSGATSSLGAEPGPRYKPLIRAYRGATSPRCWWPLAAPL